MTVTTIVRRHRCGYRLSLIRCVERIPLKVIWIYGFGASIVYTVFGWIFVPETPSGIGIYVVLGLAWCRSICHALEVCV